MTARDKMKQWAASLRLSLDNCTPLSATNLKKKKKLGAPTNLKNAPPLDFTKMRGKKNNTCKAC